MEVNISSNSNSNSSKKQKKRKTHKRKPQQDKPINVSQTRREIVHFIYLYRAAAASPSPSPSSSTRDQLDDSFGLSRNVSRHQYNLQPLMCYPTIENLPIWSTTEPSVLAPPPLPPPPLSPIETLPLFDCTENQSSWWFEFLNAMDCKNLNASDEVSKCHAFGDINKKIFNGKDLFGQLELNVAGYEEDVDDDDQFSTSPDEWLTFPSTED